MGRKKLATDPLRASATKVAWKEWIERNPDQLHQVPRDKLPKREWLVDFFKTHPEAFNSNYITREDCENVATYIFNYKKDFRSLPLVLQYASDSAYYQALIDASMTFEDVLLHRPQGLKLWGSQYSELLIMFGERATEVLAEKQLSKLVHDFARSTLVTILRSRPELVFYARKEDLTPTALFQIRCVQPQIDIYLAAMI